MGYLSDRQFNSTLTRVFKVSGKWLNASPGSKFMVVEDPYWNVGDERASSQITAHGVTDECCDPASQVISISHHVIRKQNTHSYSYIITKVLNG